MEFNVSVIIPVFNAEKSIARAIQSAIELDVVKEVIVIDDGSKDSSLAICNSLASSNEKIKILIHSKNINKGVSASRNLGIKTAKSEFIAFLDSDDYYLPNRFDAEKELYKKINNFDGAYGASEWVWIQTGEKRLYSISEYIEPDNLFKVLLWHNKGLFHISTITIKKKLLNRIGYFDENMPVAEDSELWYRVAAFGKIYTGQIHTPIATRIIHGNNVFIKAKDKYDYYYKYLYKKMFIHFLFSYKINYNNKNELFMVFNCYKYLFSEVYSDKSFILKTLVKFPILFFCPFIYHKTLQLIKEKHH